jgi:hypothetical protein
MARCPKGHDSTTADYCDVCGAPMTAGTSGGPATPAGPATASPATAGPALSRSAAPPEAAAGTEQAPCPVCGTPRTGRFCEQDGYDFVAAALGGGSAAPAAAEAPEAPGAPAAPAAPAPELGPGVAPEPAGGPAPSRTWQVVVGADRTYFDLIRAQGGEDAGSLSYPRFVAERRFPLRGERVTIGRHSRSRGIHPDIDLVGPPEDPGVSRLHALLVAQPDQSWAVVDLDSANGTYVNDPSSDPIESQVPVPVTDGDTIYLGAWTTLTLRRG